MTTASRLRSGQTADFGFRLQQSSPESTSDHDLEWHVDCSLADAQNTSLARPSAPLHNAAPALPPSRSPMGIKLVSTTRSNLDDWHGHRVEGVHAPPCRLGVRYYVLIDPEHGTARAEVQLREWVANTHVFLDFASSSSRSNSVVGAETMFPSPSSASFGKHYGVHDVQSVRFSTFISKKDQVGAAPEQR
eukprot:6205733-Pleurochrysis_carterae.AAC.5